MIEEASGNLFQGSEWVFTEDQVLSRDFKGQEGKFPLEKQLSGSCKLTEASFTKNG